ncbi:MAG TPA: helix-turn-helix domain-containing protein [Acidimicrobiales bacterium]|nr:helix-turn-helix domain-containing protein [Acidimicrobiales bacterium]
MTGVPDELLSPSKVAERLGISPEEALDLMLSGEIGHVDRNGAWFVTPDAVDEYRMSHSG